VKVLPPMTTRLELISVKVTPPVVITCVGFPFRRGARVVLWLPTPPGPTLNV
jgi:hypothetical protein